jgi:hypothetical protein
MKQRIPSGSRRLRKALLSLGFLTAVSCGFGLVAAQSAPLTHFDGRWSVLVIADQGS